MKRLAVSLLLAGLSGVCFADQPAFCTSMCASSKSQCLSNVTALSNKEGLLPTGGPDKNPYARTAQVDMRASDGGSLARAGDDYRRQERAGSCDTAFQRCTRGCNASDSDAVGAVVSRHARKAG
jgi:hypothetical protein